MRLKPRVWFLISLLLFAAAICTWQYADKYAAAHRASTAQPETLKGQHPPGTNTTVAAAGAKRSSYRISNTTQNIKQLLHNSHALILRNALIDTEVPVALKIPAHLRAKGAPGSYLVQADRPLDKGFYAELAKAGATYISYVPNNAALVQASPTQATNLAANADVVAVLPYDPYYKLDTTLLPSAVEEQPQTNALSVTTYPGQRDAALAALTQLGAKLIGEDRSPFGPTLIVSVPAASLVAIAQLPLAQEIEVYTPRRLMNDLTLVQLGVATNTLIGTPNYLGLSGAGVTVNINDTGVDATHPDFSPAGRLLGDNPGSLTDSDGHGTHVAGIIAGNGSQSTTVGHPIPGSVINADFRGKATNATLFVQALDLNYGPFVSDSFLQENASSNLGPTNLISNDSWGYGSTSYDVHAASFDAATRDAQPNVDGEQPLLFVFAAGNNYNGANTITSPGTAKNVITVGASDSPRNITNLVYEGTNTNNVFPIFLNDTDNSNLVASFSSAGNVDPGVEGTYGRFKPDVVAPGVFTISCRASNYIDPSNEVFVTDYSNPNQTVALNQTNIYSFGIPSDTSGFVAIISSNAASPVPFPTNMLILANLFNPPTTIVSSNNFYSLTGYAPNDVWYFGIAPPTNSPGPVNYNVDFYLYETNNLGDYFTVLSNLNNVLKPYYRYESGTSMSAGAVSGVLALMQEFLQTHTANTNPSPALLKAMLINGSRSLGEAYDFDVNTVGANEQGWGLPNITNSIPRSLASNNTAMLLVDQSPNNALATGQYQTYTINCTDTNAIFYPLRISLVWTDPPGNPAAGIALVNNLDLTVADATGSNIYIGNDFLSGDIFTEVSNPTNLPSAQNDNAVENIYVNNGTATFTSAGDPINNVQNVYIDPNNELITFPLTVTISGTRVNVNAVTTQTNNILQDYALVVSSDDPALSSSLTITTNGITNAAPVLVTVASNGVPLLHERVGANEPNLYNFQAGLTNDNLSQWHFFIFTNDQFSATNQATNVAFATFLPPNLSIPRVSGTADIDLYVYAPATPLPDFAGFLSIPGNLNFFAEAADKSVGRTGTESIIYTNSFPDEVYYIGVKSEDQQASDFGFYGIAQQAPFSTSSADGDTITATGTSLPVFIPNAVSPEPALVFAFMFNPNPLLQYIRRVTATVGIQHPSPSDLVGTLQHNDLTAVLNLHSGQPPGYTNTYDDLQEDPNSGDVTTDPPGNLTEFVNQTASGLWLLTESDDALTQNGYVTTYTISVDLQQPQLTGFIVTIPGQSWFDDYVYVPNDATNMIIYTLYESDSASGGPIGIYLTNFDNINFGDYNSNGIVPPGGSLTLGTNNPVPGWPDAPPLAGGFWYYGIYNSNTSPVTLFVQIVIQESLTPNLVQTYTNSGPPVPLLTDAHTQTQICITNGQQVVALQVGVRIDDTNLDDLVLHLTSPEGTSVLLFEDRGGTSASGLGLTLTVTNGVETNGTTNYSTNYVYTVFTENTNLATTPIKFAPPPFAAVDITPEEVVWSNSFETLTNGVYTNGAVLEGWLVTSNVVDISTTNGPGYLTNDEVGIVTDPNGEIYGTNGLSLGSNYLALTSGHIVQTFGGTNTFGTNKFSVTNGLPYELVFYAKPMGITDWWPADDNNDDIIGTHNGTIPYSDVSNNVGEVDQAWSFSGVGQSPDGYKGNEVDFGTSTANFGTNDFSIDFWIKQPPTAPTTVAVLEKRPDCNANLSELSIRSGPVAAITGSKSGGLDFEVSSDNIINTYYFVANKPINDNLFHHAAFTRLGTTLSIYLDGILNISAVSPGIANILNSAQFRAGQSVCVAPGVGDPGDGTEPFQGELDELDLFNRALSPAEVYAIYHAGSLGKYNTNSILPNFTLTVDDVLTNNIIFTNASGGWQLFTNSFIATNGEITVEFSGNAMGVLLDDIQLIQLPATNYNNYYLPEEPLSPFVGENPLGCWTLDVWDTRADSPLPTDGTLLSWTMQVTTSSTNATLYVLDNRVPLTITNLTTNGIAYFAVDVPYYANYATNILTANSGGPLTWFFNQNALPTGGLPGDVTFATGVQNAADTNTLSTKGGLPPLLPGQRYFMGVLNTGGSIANFTIEVDFDVSTNIVIPLTNDIAFPNQIGTNIIGTNGPQYYSFLVPTNAIMVTFQILNPTNGEVDLYARDGMPLPGPLGFDYESRNAGTNDQIIVITTNSAPVPLPVSSTNDVIPPPPNIWYLGVYNFAETNNVGYSIIATVVTNGQLTIIPLTNAIPFTNTAPPGYPSNLLYSFTVTNSPSGIQFTVTNLTNVGNVELLASLDVFPTPEDSFAGSFNPGTNAQFIQVVPNAALPSLNGTWYLAVPNTSATNVSYSIEALTNYIVPPAIVPLTWNGNVDSYWDILATSNWVVTGTSTPYPYQDGSPVTFDDTATGTTVVTLSTTLAPSSIVMNNNTFTYYFIGGGTINGAPLSMNGSGTLILDNSTPNNFSSVALNSGTLQIGNDDYNGSLATSGSILGPTTFTDNGTLTFARFDNVAIPNVITGGGGLVQQGAGILTLSGLNSYTGSTLISGSTIVVDNTNALGAWGGGSVTIASGATLDLSGLTVANGPNAPLFGAKQFNVSGAGATGNGAIINNGPNQQLGGLQNIKLAADTSIGGSTRWDVRNGTPTLTLSSHTLTKIGNNQISVVSASVTSGNVIINEGILSFERTPSFSGAGTITVNSGALVGQFLDTLGSFTRTIILNGGGTTNLSGGGFTYLDAPIQLVNNSSLGNGGGTEIFRGIISGGFGLANLGGGSNLLWATNTYTGATFVEQGTLGLTNTGSISNSTSIAVDFGANLDATLRIDHTFTLASNQTLFDDGTVLGSNVVANAGSTLFGTGTVNSNLTLSAGATFSPGAGAGLIGAFTVTGTAFLGGTNLMEINAGMSPSNDVLIASNVVYGGLLLVTNLGVTNNPLVLGNTFTLYNVSNSSGAFSSLILPPLTAGLTWSTTFGNNGPGIISVVTNTAPVITQSSLALSPANVVITGTNGVPGGQYVVLTSTNVSLPLTSWTPTETNYFDNLGHFNFTNALSTNKAQFFILQSP